MESDSQPLTSGDGSLEPAGPATEELVVTADGHEAVSSLRRRGKAPWVVAAVAIAAGVAAAVINPFSSPRPGGAGSGTTGASGTYTVTRQDLSSQTQVPATLGYAGTYTIAIASGASAQGVAQAQQAVTADEQALSADERATADAAAVANQAIAADQTNVSTDQSTLSSDQAAESQACAGTGTSSAACTAVTQKVSQDQTALTQANEELASAQTTATSSENQAQAKVGADQTKLAGDQATLASEQSTEVDPGTAYTWLPAVGAVIKEGQPVYSVDNQSVPLLYGSIPAYRVFSVGMSDGADVGELTQDLITLGYGAGLTQSNHYSTATAAAVERWQAALGLPQTGEILLGQVVFEPGPIRVTSVAPSVGAAVGSGGGGGGGGGGGSGGAGAVLSASSTTRQVRIALDASEESLVAVGDKVSITLPNRRTTPGVVSSVGTVATAAASGGPPASGSSGTSGSSSPTITVLVKPTRPAATGTWDQAPVNVTITTGSVNNVLVVPVDALLARPGGGYAVQVAGADGKHHLESVTLGLFDDAQGLVQVSGPKLAGGQRVVVPKQ